MPFLMLAGIPVKLIMSSFTQLVRAFDRSHPVALLTKYLRQQVPQSEIRSRQMPLEKFSIGVTTLLLGVSREILGMFLPKLGFPRISRA
jgi:hypothetical protein